MGFWRDGFWRTSVNGNVHWVEGHWVERDDWGRSSGGKVAGFAPDHPEAARWFTAFSSGASYSSCYINPNAECPVCGSEVFFYANAAGSRVYFDELGPPWPKHPCTDNSPQLVGDENIRPMLCDRGEKPWFRSAFTSNHRDYIVAKRKARGHGDRVSPWRLIQAVRNQKEECLLVVECMDPFRSLERLAYRLTEHIPIDLTKNDILYCYTNGIGYFSNIIHESCMVSAEIVSELREIMSFLEGSDLLVLPT